MDLNAAGLLRADEDEGKALAVDRWSDSSLYTDTERVALAYAEAVTLSDQDVDDEQFAALRGILDEDEIVELTAWIVLENLYSKFNRAIRIEAQGFCRLSLPPD